MSENYTNLTYGNVLKDKYARQRFTKQANLLSPFLKNGVKILDIGCYTADLLNFLPSNVEYYGVDNDKKALKIAEGRGAKVFNIDLENQSLLFEWPEV